MKIKTTLFILGLASLCLAVNGDNETTPREKSKANYFEIYLILLFYSLPGVLSLFSIVQFPNDECTTTDVNVKKGVCTTSTECTAGSGTQSGNCASGFGGERYNELSPALGIRGLTVIHFSLLHLQDE